MMLLDANLLLYANSTSYAQHRDARGWFDDRLNGTARVGIPWPSLLAFLRIATNPRIFTKPVSISFAWARVEEWLASPVVWIPEPTASHSRILSRMLKATNGANSVPDAHLAALAVEHGLTLCTADNGFARYPGLTWRNPLNTPNER